MTEEELRATPCRSWALRLDAAENVCELAERYGFSQLEVAVAAWRRTKPRWPRELDEADGPKEGGTHD